MISILIQTLIFGGILMFFFPNKILMCGVCGGCVIIIGLFIIYDTQVIANKTKYGLSYDDYIIGSILLYTVKII
jgi:FtsH-binding integral membrane protein